MFGSTILEVGMGLILIYLVLSLVCSAINEQISQALSLRGETLWNAVKQLLGDPQGTGLANELFNTHLVRSQISKDIKHKDDATNKVETSKGKVSPNASVMAKPSYLSPQIFSAALMQITEGGKLFTEVGSQSLNLTSALHKATVDGEILAKAAPEISAKVKEAFGPIVEDAGKDVDKVRAEMEAMFNASMDRAAGVYKQQIQRITVIVGLLIAWSANADTLAIAQKLWVSPALRQASVAAATAAVSRPASDNANSKSTENPDTAPAVPKMSPELTAATEPLLGWGKEADQLRSSLTWDYHKWGWLLTKIIGILITGFAVSLGAPYWFDMLSKVINVRGSVKPDPKPAGGG